MKHLSRYIPARLLSAIAFIAFLFLQPIFAKAQESTVYIQFSGVGRTVLYADASGAVSSRLVNAGAPTENGFKWVVTVDGERATLHDASGRYLLYENGAFTTTTNAADATAFGWTKNTYYNEADLTRYQLLLPESTEEAVGVRGGKLQAVKANSRYSVIYQTKEVQGPELPLFSTDEEKNYHKFCMLWGGNAIYGEPKSATDFLGIEGNSLKEINQWADNNDSHAWTFLEANEQGDVLLQNKQGYYLKQTDANSSYTITTNKAEAVTFQLVEAVDQGAVEWTNTRGKKEIIPNQYWYQFWQLKNTANSNYFFEGNQSKFGGQSIPSPYNAGITKYKFAFGRLRFENVEDAQYIQFPAMGRKVLSTDGASVVVENIEEGNTMPATDRWYLEEQGDGEVKIKSKENYYIGIDNGAFRLETDADAAAVFTKSVNQFYGADAPTNRYCLTLADDATKALGVDINDKLSLVTPNSRFSVVRISDVVKGVNAPVISNDEITATWYNMTVWYGQQSEENTYTESNGSVVKVPNYLYSSGTDLKPTQDTLNIHGDAYEWAFFKADDLGNVYVMNKEGLYLRQDTEAKKYSLTTDISKASKISLAENFDGGQVVTFYDKDKKYVNAAGHDWSRFWMLKSTTGGYLYCGWENVIGGTTDNKIYNNYKGTDFASTIGKYGMAHARMEFIEIPNNPKYLQFTGSGRYVLQSDDATGEVSVYHDTFSGTSTPAVDGKTFKWRIASSNSHAYLVNGQGKYLAYDELKGFLVVDDIADACRFSETENEYYKETGLNRINLNWIDGDDEPALGFKNGRLQWVKKDTRYSLIYLCESVKGQDMALLSSGMVKNWYHLNYYYREETTSNVVSPDASGTSLTAYKRENAGKINTDGTHWVAVEANENGDIILRNKLGQYFYLPNEDTTYQITMSKDEAAVLRPVESVHRGKIWAKGAYVENQEWPDFWQLKDVKYGKYLYIGDSSQMGGNSHGSTTHTSGEESGVTTAGYGYSFNRMQFDLQDTERIALPQKPTYLQFSGQGRTVLYIENDDIIVTQTGTDSIPEAVDACYKWLVENNGNDIFYLRNGEEGDAYKYLKIETDKDSITFSLVDSRNEATPLNVTVNEYYAAENLTRFNLLLASDNTKAIGVKAGQLQLVATNSRYSVVRLPEDVKGPVPPVLNKQLYNLPFLYSLWEEKNDGSKEFKESTNYAQLDLERTDKAGFEYAIRANDAIGNRAHASLLWTVREANSLGDIILENEQGYYLYQENKTKCYSWTEDKSKATVMRLVEFLDGGSKRGDYWTNHWQMKNTATGEFMYVGWDYSFNGSQSDKLGADRGLYGYSNNRFDFEPFDIPKGYLLFSAFGPYPLCDNDSVGNHKEGIRPTVHPEHSDINDAGAIWEVITQDDEHIILKSENGNYIACEEDKNGNASFFCTSDETKAYHFTRNYSHYQNNKVVRYELANEDNTKALRITNAADTNQGILTWGEAGTRYSAIHFFPLIAGPTLPDINRVNQPLKMYSVYTSSNTFGQYLLRDNMKLSAEEKAQDTEIGTEPLADQDYTATTDIDNFDGDTEALWFIETIKTPKADGSEATAVGDVYLRTYHGRYLAYDETKERFVSTEDKAKASIVRLIETDVYYTPWQMQILGTASDLKYADVANNVLHVVKDRDKTTNEKGDTVYVYNGKFYLTLGEPNCDKAGETSFFHFDLSEIYPEFYDEDGGALRRFQFIDTDGSCFIEQKKDGTVDANGANETDNIGNDVMWKSIGTYDNFFLKSADGLYLKIENGKLVMTENRDEATHFGLLQNTAKVSNHILWCFCPLEKDGDDYVMPSEPKALYRNSDGSISLVKYEENYTKPETGIYFETRLTPRFSCSKHTFLYYMYFPTFNKDNYRGLRQSEGVYLKAGQHDVQSVYNFIDWGYCVTGRQDNGNLIVVGHAKERNWESQNSGYKPEYINAQLWSLAGTHDDFVIRSRDNTYLMWSNDNTFGYNDGFFVTTLKKEDAARFELELGKNEQGRYYVIKLKDPKTTTSLDLTKPHYLNFKKLDGTQAGKLGDNVILTLQDDSCAVQLEEWSVVDAEDYSHFNIRHKRSWFVKQASDDTDPTMTDFIEAQNSEQGWDTNENTSDRIQKTNVYKIDHYLKDGTYTHLHLPSYMRKSTIAGGTSISASDIRAYQRYYNYDTETNIDSLRVILKRRSRRSYHNGTIMGAYLNANNSTGAFVGEMITFQMPPLTDNNYRYTVAIDASAYSDFVDYFGDNGLTYDNNFTGGNGFVLPDNQDLIEPTLSSRYIYVIHSAREMADSLALCLKERGNDKWLEEYDIAFPKKKVSFKNCTLPLKQILKDYWFYDNPTAIGNSADRVQNANEALVNVSSYDNIEIEVDPATNTAGIACVDGEDTYFIDGSVYKDNDGKTQTNAIGDLRFIRFLYPKMQNGAVVKGKFAGDTELGYAGTSVDETQTTHATIKVYVREKGSEYRYQLAKFNLTFVPETEPRPDEEIVGYADTIKHTYKSSRSPLALRSEIGEPAAQITFNPTKFKTFVTPPFGRSTLNRRTGSLSANNAPYPPSTVISNSYGYPIDYDHTSYDFEPYNYYGDLEHSDESRFGSYTISKKLSTKYSRKKKVYVPIQTIYKNAYPDLPIDDSKAAFMYIDASELPGTICSLQYDGTLCRGSRLYFSAWIASPNGLSIVKNGDVYRSDDYTVPANVIFTVKGVMVDEETGKTTKEVELYSYCPGPIFEDARKANGETLERGEGELGIWQHIYFDFINDSPEEFHHYELTVNNACTSTNGGDILLDNISMFARKPDVRVQKTTPLCGQQVTLAKISTDYNGLLSALGFGLEEKPTNALLKLWYCMLDKEVYDTKLEELAALRTDGKATTEDIKVAYDLALIGDSDSGLEGAKPFGNVNFPASFESLDKFEYKNILGQPLDRASVSGEVVDGKQYLVISDRMKSDKLKGNHEYYLVFVPRYGGDDITKENAYTNFQMGSNCCIISIFKTTPAIHFIPNGADEGASGDTIFVCSNANVNVTAKLNGYRTDDGTATTVIPKYDWWLDFHAGSFYEAYINSKGEYVTAADTTGQKVVSVREALENFRHFYPKAISFDDVTAKRETDSPYELTLSMIRGLEALTKSESPTYDDKGNIIDEGHPAYLHLYNSALNVTVKGLKGEIKNITLIPINETTESNIVYCYDPQTLNIKITGEAPGMDIGFRSMDDSYPSNLGNLSLRTSLESIGKFTSSDVTTNPEELLRLPLRNIKFINDEAIGLKTIKRTDGVKYAPVYLVGTNDNSMGIYKGEKELDYKVVGVVKNMVAKKSTDTDAYAHIFFLKDFKPREGYTYSLRFEYNEEYNEEYDTGKKPSDEARKDTCDGALAFNLKIVPKYLVWTGEAENNDFTDDNNWQRADRTKLLFSSSDETDYVTNADNGTSRGLAPLVHSSLVMARASEVANLYYVKNPEAVEGSSMPKWKHFLQFCHENRTEDTPAQRTATPNIEFDLILGEKIGENGDSIVLCQPYRTYESKDILLQPRAEMLHTERLEKYSRFFMEYELDADRWYTLGSPFKRMYAGDWYAPTNGGRQLTPYFHDINYDTKLNDRFSPAVYQRGWDKGKATVYSLPDNSDPYSTPIQTLNVAIKADWSSVYNEVMEQYGGELNGGFSLKTNSSGKGNTYSSLLFRLPKQDTNFSYFTSEQPEHGSNDTTVVRTVNGSDLTSRLITDDLIETESAQTTEVKQTITNSVPDNLFFLVSNPFPCGLDMYKFFKHNESLLEYKFWLLTSDGQMSAVKDLTSDKWITVNTPSNGIDGVLPAGQGFFVKAKSAQSQGALTVSFTADMMASATTSNSFLRSARQTRATASDGTTATLRLKATRAGTGSEAYIVKRAEANNDFVATEDLETLADETQAGVPTVYSLAGHQASTVNFRQSMQRIPLGIISDSPDTVQLSFSGMNTFSEELSLLDNATGLVMPLPASNSEVTISVPGNTSGRYFILSSEKSQTSDDFVTDKPLIKAEGDKLTVTSPAAHPLTSLQIVDTAGRTLYNFRPFTSSVSLTLPVGIYIISAANEAAESVAKVTMTNTK